MRISDTLIAEKKPGGVVSAYKYLCVNDIGEKTNNKVLKAICKFMDFVFMMFGLVIALGVTGACIMKLIKFIS